MPGFPSVVAILAVLALSGTAPPERAVRREGNALIMDGHAVTTLNPRQPDTSIIIGALTTDVTMTIVAYDALVPLALDGRPVYADSQYQEPPVFATSPQNVGDYLLDRLRPLLQTLPDGYYNIQVNSLLIDDEGRIAYCRTDGLASAWRYGRKTGKPIQAPPPPATARTTINEALERILVNELRYQPAMYQGRPVPARPPGDGVGDITLSTLIVQNGIVTQASGTPYADED